MEESKVVDLGQEKFDDFLNKSDKLTVVEFFTATCPVCQSMVPVYSRVATELSGNAIFIRVDANRNAQLAQRFGVMGVPAIKFFCGGKEVGGIVGMTNATALANTVKDFIRHGAGCKSTALVYEMDGYG